MAVVIPECVVPVLVNSEANTRRIATVESCFGNSGQPLEVPGRVLVGEGVLVKMCRKKPKTRQFFLFNDILVYGNIIINKKKYNKQHIIPLEEVKLENLEDDNRELVRAPRSCVYPAFRFQNFETAGSFEPLPSPSRCTPRRPRKSKNGWPT